MNENVELLISELRNKTSFIIEDGLQETYGLIQNYINRYIYSDDELSRVYPGDIKALISRYFKKINSISDEINYIIGNEFNNLNEKVIGTNNISLINDSVADNIIFEIDDLIKQNINRGLSIFDEEFIRDLRFEILSRPISPEVMNDFKKRLFNKTEESMYDFRNMIKSSLYKNIANTLDEYKNIAKNNIKKDEKKENKKGDFIWNRIQKIYESNKPTIESSFDLLVSFQAIVDYFKQIYNEGFEFNNASDPRMIEFNRLISVFETEFKNIKNKKQELNEESLNSKTNNKFKTIEDNKDTEEILEQQNNLQEVKEKTNDEVIAQLLS